MKSVDVNVLVPAWDAGAPDHPAAAAWLEAAVAAAEPLGVSELVVSGALRVLTHPRVPGMGHDPGAVLERAGELLDAPGVVRLRPGRRHFALFRDVVRATGATGNEVPDCYHAALALEHEATWMSRDGFFARVPGLRWSRPW
ncbi:TA system VapC family ribonuclease toxin [Kineococcus sp. G2]|uniref:TA system VapC family ribonuclease toxin n=1 Tax=Kineococcus sp. G2 TaxID=3127484 RepID=UPI00301D384D